MDNNSQKIFIEQTRLIYSSALIPLIISIALGTLLCWSIRNITDHTILLIWFAVFLIISIFRGLNLFLYRTKFSNDGDNRSWHLRFLIGTYGAASMWGAASLFLFPEHSLSHQIVFIIIITGLIAGGVSSLSPSLLIFTGFISLILIPLSVKLFTLGTGDEVSKALLVLLFGSIVLIGGIRISRNIQENIELRIQSVNRERVLKINEERYRHIFESAPLGIFQYDAQSKILDCNDEFVRILGSTKEMLIGLDMLSIVPEGEMLAAIKESFAGEESYYEGKYTSVTGNTTTPVRAFFKTIRHSDQNILGGVGVVEDFTEKEKSEQLIRHHASYDSLTGLPNRRLLLEILEREMSRAKRHGHFGALLFLDLDNFKTINDSLGHSVGDELLKIVAQRISECIRLEDAASRMGGDEFIIVFTELGNDVEVAAHKAKGIAEELSLCLSAPCQIENRTLQVTSSVGVSMFPQSEKGVDDILKQADTAMYRAKAAGRDEICFFLPSMQEVVDEKLRLNTEIRAALDNNEFTLFFQPQVEYSGKLLGAEVLIRWRHPVQGIIPPGTFLHIAEETSLIQDIGRWVLRESCKWIKTWSDRGLLKDSCVISVNISSKEIDAPGFVSMVIDLLAETGVNPKNIGIELTEGSLINIGQDIVQKIMTLRKSGIKFSIDDFGTGYSSLSYLKSLPLNTLKIDRSFVNDIREMGDDAVLVDTIIMMARNLGLDVIAEGVETEEELQYLNSRGCMVYQGYYFSRPVEIDVFTTMLESGSSAIALPPC